MRGAAIGLGVLALMVFGFLFFRGPAPTIIVAPETIFHLGSLAVTNTIFTSWIVVALLCLVAVIAGPRISLVPSGFSGLIEAMVAGFFSVVAGVVGEERGKHFFMLVATIFFYVITSNYLGLLPGNMFIGKPEVGHGAPPVEMRPANIAGIDVLYVPFGAKAGEEHDEHAAADTAATDTHATETKAATDTHATESADVEGTQYGILAPYLRSVNTDINTPLAIAIYSFLFVEFWGFQALGFGYLKKFFNFGAMAKGPMGLIDVFVGLLEFVSELSRMVSFTFRLFGNVFAGEVLLTMMGFLVPLVLIDVFYGLELFVGAIQAFVFAMLTLVFAQSAVAHHGDDHEEGHEAAHH
ncbi:MAG: F0F1 ATP synthase subunit A [Dehalococcoidia bacterium]|nr:F0F1 ATP synthase subunit A [Dehalococcoidia bacterium]